MTNPVSLLGIALTVLLAAAAHGLAGFGFVLVGAPLLLLFLSSKEVVGLMICLALPLEALVLRQSRRPIPVRPLIPLVVGSFAGSLAGATVLHFASPDALRFVMLAIMVPTALALAMGYRRPIRAQAPAVGVIGILSGALNATIGMSGPPVALFLSNQRWDRDSFRTGLNAFFLVSDAFTVIILLGSAAFSPIVVVWALALMPPLLLGYYAGTRGWRRVNDSQLAWAVAGATIVGASLSVVSARR